jgi:hypothetical protein
MRTVDAAITAGEISPAPAYRHKAFIYNPLLAFAAPSSNADGALDLAAPQTYRMRSSGNVAYAAYRHTNGTHYLRAVDVTSAANASLAAANAVTIANSGTMAALRSGFSIESGTHYIYTAVPSGGAIQVQRASLSGTTNPLTASFSNYGPTFGSALTNTATFIRRVEAVCPCDNGQVVVAVGEHDFTNSLSTITFWFLPTNAAAVQLNAILHVPFGEAYSSWYGNAKHCAFISAAYESATDRIIVVANAAASGRAVYFTIQNGVESAVRSVIPIDASVTTVNFLPASLTSINGWLYLTGRMTRKRTSGAALTAFDGYLIGDASGMFSLGERSHVVTTSTCYGALLLPAGGSTVYYIGNGNHTTAAATPFQNSSITGTEYTSRLIGWTLDQGTNGADGFSATLDNADGALSTDSLLAGGKVLQLQSGQGATLANMGEYGLDRPRVGVSVSGRAPLAISGRSLGDKTLLNWKSPLTLQLMARSRIKTDLADGLAGLIQKTAEMNSARLGFNSTGMVYRGLNEPWIALADEYDHGDGLTHLVTKADVSDAYHLSTIGVLIGASDEGRGNVFVLPKDGTWGDDVLTGPQMRVLSLNSIDPLDPNKDDTGWNMTPRANGLVKAVDTGNVRSVAATGSYLTSSSFAMTPGTKYGVAVRTAGRRAQLWTRAWNLAPASCAANAGYTLRSEFVFGYQARKSHSDTPRSGVAISTDVWGDSSALSASSYEDFEQTLTHAVNWAVQEDFNVAAVNCNGQSPIGDRLSVNCTATPSMLIVGQYVRLAIPDNSDQILRIAGITGNNVQFTSHYGLSAPGANGTIYTLYTHNVWGTADCGKRNYVATEADELGDLPMPIDPKAKKKGRASRGRGIFVTDDNTAASIRMLETDGVRFYLWSGGENGTRVGWDLTNPIAADDDPFYDSSSDPSVWRVVMHHGYVFDGAPASKGLPSIGYLMVDDEVIRYASFTFYKRGMAAQNTWTIVPAFYAPLAAATGPTSTLRNWRSSGGAQPGDDLGDIQTNFGVNPAGLMVEVVSKNGAPGEGDKQYYVASATKVGSPTAGNTSYVTLTEPYENSVRGPDPDSVLADGTINPALAKTKLEGDLAVLSGRGQWGTAKTTHEADAPVVYYPCDANGAQATVTLESYRYFSGLYVSLRDAIQRTARLAGMRSAAFRYAFSTPTAVITQAITTTPYSLPARENLSDFVLRMQAFLPVSGRLNVYFRSYYRLTLQHNGSGGVLVGLATTKSAAQGGVDADGSGDRWLGYLTVPVNAWISTTATKNVEITLAVVGDDIVIELGGQPLFTFDLTLFEGDTWNYNVQTAGPIQVEYTATQSGNSATFELIELFDEAGDIVIEESARGDGRSARGVIDSIIGARMIRSRATQAGGVEFSQFWTRDDIGELRKNLLKHNWEKADKARTAHQKVTGLDDVGEVLDMTVIAADGYDFSGISTEITGAPNACQVESRLQGRESAEFAEEHELSGYGRLAAQPEDRCALAYGPGGDIATQASTNMVITGVRLDAQNASVKATYKLRLYKDVPA